MSMRDFTLTCYNCNLWINEINCLEMVNKKFLYKTSKCGIVQIQFLTIFGTITEMKHFDEKCIYYVDDGTGVIGCIHKYEVKEELENSDLREMINFDLTSDLTMGDASSLCDTVFNDRTVQPEDVEAHQMAALKALESLRWSLINSFRASECFSIGDSVCVHGKLYSYFGTPQLYVNVIRPISMTEELVLTSVKLENGITAVSDSQQISTNEVKIMPSSEKLSVKPQRRPSGLMTFDTVEVRARNLKFPSAGFLPVLPSPPSFKGALAVPSGSNEPLTTFDTFYIDENDGSSSDSDLFIPETPKKVN